MVVHAGMESAMLFTWVGKRECMDVLTLEGLPETSKNGILH